MQRIARLTTAADEDVAGAEDYAELQVLLRRHLPPTTAAMFAQPRSGASGLTEWYSNLEGQPLRLSEVDGDEAQEALKRLDERRAGMRQLADRLESSGEKGRQQAALLRRAASRPAAGSVFVLNGQPVVTAWGGAGPDPALAPDPVPVPVIQEKPRRRWWPWWLLALLLLGLLAAILWWWFCKDRDVASSLDAQGQMEMPVIESPQPLDPEDSPLEKLARRLEDAGNDCSALLELRDDPLLQGSTDTIEQLKKEIDLRLQTHCREQLIVGAAELCPEDRPSDLAPEIVVVFDASGSMDFSIDASEEEIERFLRQSMRPSVSLLDAFLGAGAQQRGDQHLKREPRRMTTAKQSTLAVLQQLPNDIKAGLVLLEDCPAARTVGFYSPAQRGELIANVNGITSMSGTPLADGIRKAGQMLDGVNRTSIMLVVSDGSETCHEDPCVVAAQLAQQKPHLTINVVDILGTGAGNCLAQATGGRVFKASNAAELDQMTRLAAGEALQPDHCRQ